MWSDESRFRLFQSDGRNKVWRKRGHRLLQQNIVQTHSGGGSVHVWGAFWRGGRCQLVVLHEYVNGAVYRETLNQHVLPLVHVLGDPQRDWLFQDDNALPHRARSH